MIGTASLIDRPATRDDVIAWLNADYRLRSGFDPEVDPGFVLSRDTTISEWRSVCDLVGPRSLARVMNNWFGCELPDREWAELLEPEGTRTLGGIADRIAPLIRFPDFAPATVAGQVDPPAGAFFALRRLVAQKGIEISDMRPSTRIATLSEAQVAGLGMALAKLGPGLTPEPIIEPFRRQQIGVVVALVSVIALVASLTNASRLFAAFGLCGLVAGVFMVPGKPKSIQFGSFTTVGDIARALAAERKDREPRPNEEL